MCGRKEDKKIENILKDFNKDAERDDLLDIDIFFRDDYEDDDDD